MTFRDDDSEAIEVAAGSSALGTSVDVRSTDRANEEPAAHCMWTFVRAPVARSGEEDQLAATAA